MNINELNLMELRRFAELGRLSATMLHEISNPLSAAILQLELTDHASPALKRAKRNMQTLRSYVEAARQQISASGQAKNFAIQTQLDQLKRITLPMARQAGVKLEFDTVPTGCKLYGDPVIFQQLLANLVVNAIQAYHDTEVLASAALVRVSLTSSQEWLTIQVQDWGKGITPKEMPKLFEPFYTTKAGRKQGLGLGLAIVKQYVTNDFHGSIRVSSTRRLGTQFIIELPRLV